MRLRAQIVIDVDAEDFVQAAQHQVRIESFLRELEPDYPSVLLTFRERRAAAIAGGEGATPAVKKPTGKLNVYEDTDDEA